ncbi:centrosomal protein of 164 kDa isoform X1 [Zerene cesonia]|uniref:centrosomal protein of 164 kDa isoform X1 n=1 Tax=Zerene cesonia TaxID=33412 RepID=UPI0018E584C1|nr:centrosomal protein of 164 kDa isoform X1 [Zerene cesonia]
MNSPSIVACREIFDENSQPSAEEISEYACQLGIDPESETHLLPLARDGLMQALPPPWKAYYDEKLQSHYYYNEETKKTQWEHPLDHVYRELVKKARDASMLDDTCASVQELLTSEENTKNLERVETKVESDEDELTTDSDQHPSDVKDANTTLTAGSKRPLGRPPLGPLSRLDRKLSDLRISPLRRSVDSPVSSKPNLVRNISDRDILNRPTFERPKTLFKQQSEIIDLKMHVLSSPEENFSPLLSSAKVDKGLPLTGKGNMFLRISRSNLPSPDTEKSLNLDSVTKSDPPKGILREKSSDYIQRRIENIVSGKNKQASSFDEDKKSVRFKLENLPEPTVSPGSNSSSEQNDGQSSIISAPAPIPSPLNPITNTNTSPLNPPTVPLNSIVLSPLVSRPPIPPRIDSPREIKSISGSEKESLASENRDNRGASPRRRLVKPPPSDYIKPGLFQKNFHKISDLVRRSDIEPTPVNLDEPTSDKEVRPRSPLIPQKSKISINLMESIESETSIDSPDREFANLDLNDLDDSNENQNVEETESKEIEKDKSPKIEDASEKSYSKTDSLQRNLNIPIPSIKIPKLDFTKQTKFAHSDSEDSRKSNKEDEPKSSVRSNSIDIPKDLRPQLKLSPTPSLGAERSPRLELNKPWSSPLSTFKPLNKAVIAPLKSSDSACSLGKSLSPRLDGVMLSQGKSSSDNVVVVYQFETQDESPKIKSPIPDMGVREMVERNKADERRRLELNLQKELEMIRVEFTAKERRMRAELQTELREAEEKFLNEKSMRLSEQTERHKREMEETLSTRENNHQQALENSLRDLENKYQCDVLAAQRQHESNMAKVREDYARKLSEQKEELEIENERALSEVRDQLQMNLYREKSRIIEENRTTIDALREEHTARITDLRHDYRAEVERLRSQHACHLEELRARLAGERAARHDERALHDKYRCLKEKYARLKHDVKMSIERRNKRREMSMTTGSETEKSNSHKANQSLERCKEVNETSVSAIVETEPPRLRLNNNPMRYNDNETSYSESNQQRTDNNNDEWKNRDNQTGVSSLTSALKQSRNRRTGVAFREPPRHTRTGATTDYQDSSDATTADEKSKEAVNGHLRRRFTRLKSASTSRLNYSPKRGEGWASPLESLRQQLRKLDDLEDQFPDLACQPAYSLRYPFAELGSVGGADTPELEFVRHRAVVEREGMRRARAVLRRRRAALKETRAELSPHRAPSEEREATELEVALHRARALLGEKEIRLRHIERALRRLAPRAPPAHAAPAAQEATTSEASSGSEAGNEAEAGGAVLRSLRALHADVRDIWRALDVRRPHTASPETSSCNMPTTSHTRMTLSAPEPTIQDNSDSVAEKAKGLRAWLQTTP